MEQSQVTVTCKFPEIRRLQVVKIYLIRGRKCKSFGNNKAMMTMVIMMMMVMMMMMMVIVMVIVMVMVMVMVMMLMMMMIKCLPPINANHILP